MQHFQHPLCNARLTAPAGQEADVDTLHVQQGYSEGYPCVRSFWKPDANEMKCLEAGAPVVLTLMGYTHTPLRIDVPNPDEGFPELPVFKHDDELLKNMWDEAMSKPGLHGGLEQQDVFDIAKTYAMQILRRYGR